MNAPLVNTVIFTAGLVLSAGGGSLTVCFIGVAILFFGLCRGLDLI